MCKARGCGKIRPLLQVAYVEKYPVEPYSFTKNGEFLPLCQTGETFHSILQMRCRKVCKVEMLWETTSKCPLLQLQHLSLKANPLMLITGLSLAAFLTLMGCSTLFSLVPLQLILNNSNVINTKKKNVYCLNFPNILLELKRNTL